VTTLLETPEMDLTFYTDHPGQWAKTSPDPYPDESGPVPHPEGPVIVDPADEFGNVEAAPEYGIDVTIYGGTITYGPWADRQR
jgi:hypothetical protein